MSLTGPVLNPDSADQSLDFPLRLRRPGLAMPAASVPSVQMPDPNAPQYRPLHGLSVLGPVLSQFAGIPTKSGLQPLEGVRQLGQRALEMPQERYQRDLKAAQTGLAMQDTASQIAERKAQADRGEAAAHKPEAPVKVGPGEILMTPEGKPIASVPAKPE